jgi:hypothetical protein
VVEGEQLFALVGKRGPRILEVAAHRLLAVEDVSGGDDLVARVTEGSSVASQSWRFSDRMCSRTSASRRARTSAVGSSAVWLACRFTVELLRRRRAT